MLVKVYQTLAQSAALILVLTCWNHFYGHILTSYRPVISFPIRQRGREWAKMQAYRESWALRQDIPQMVVKAEKIDFRCFV